MLQHNSETPFDITHRRFPSLARWKQTRVCGHVRIRHPDWGLIDLFNTHLSLPAFLTRDILSYTRQLGYGLNQLKEAKSLLSFIEASRESGCSPLLVGDFNSVPGSAVHELITRKHQLRDVVGEQSASGEGRSREFSTAGLLGLRLPIDYIFSNRRFDWLDVDGTHSFGEQAGYFHGLSDHVPLVGRFKPRHPFWDSRCAPIRDADAA